VVHHADCSSPFPLMPSHHQRTCEFSPNEQPFVNEMQGYWKSFFHTGSPTATHGEWPAIGSAPTGSPAGGEDTRGAGAGAGAGASAGAGGAGADVSGGAAGTVADEFKVRLIDLLGSKYTAMTERNADCAFWAVLEPEGL
jgi:hypothetical protein